MSASSRLGDALRDAEDESLASTPMSVASMPQAVSARRHTKPATSAAAASPSAAATKPSAATASSSDAAAGAAPARRSQRAAAAAEAAKPVFYQHDPSKESDDEHAWVLKLPPFDPKLSKEIPFEWKRPIDGIGIVKVNVVDISPLRNDKCLYNALATAFGKFTEAKYGHATWAVKQIEIGLRKAKSVARLFELDVNEAEIEESEDYMDQPHQHLSWPDGSRTRGLKEAYLNLETHKKATRGGLRELRLFANRFDGHISFLIFFFPC